MGTLSTILTAIAAAIPPVLTAVGFILRKLKEFRKEVEARARKCEEDRRRIEAQLRAVEALLGGDTFPRIVTSVEGIIQEVSPEWVRMWLGPLGLSGREVIGRRLSEIPFSGPAAAVFREMRAEVSRFQYSVRQGLELCPGVSTTVIKTSRPTPDGDLLFVSVAVPEAKAAPRVEL